jgi:SAM-dependent methyltransferase
MKNSCWGALENEEKWRQYSDEYNLHRMSLLLDIQPGACIGDVGKNAGFAVTWLARNEGSILKTKNKTSDKVPVKYFVIGSALDQLPCDGNITCQGWDGKEGKTGLEDDSMDIIINRGSLHHIEEKLDFIAEIFRVLKPGGRFFISDAVMTPELCLPWNIMSRIAEIDYHGFLTQADLTNLVVTQGFRKSSIHWRRFPRKWNEWLNSKFKNFAGDETSKTHLRAILDDILQNWLSKQDLNELQIREIGTDLWFDYTFLELLVVKPKVQGNR